MRRSGISRDAVISEKSLTTFLILVVVILRPHSSSHVNLIHDSAWRHLVAGGPERVLNYKPIIQSTAWRDYLLSWFEWGLTPATGVGGFRGAALIDVYAAKPFVDGALAADEMKRAARSDPATKFESQ